MLFTAVFYRLSLEHAREIVAKVANVVGGWETAARRAGIARADIELTASAIKKYA